MAETIIAVLFVCLFMWVINRLFNKAMKEFKEKSDKFDALKAKAHAAKSKKELLEVYEEYKVLTANLNDDVLWQKADIIRNIILAKTSLLKHLRL